MAQTARIKLGHGGAACCGRARAGHARRQHRQRATHQPVGTAFVGRDAVERGGVFAAAGSVGPGLVS